MTSPLDINQDTKKDDVESASSKNESGVENEVFGSSLKNVNETQTEGEAFGLGVGSRKDQAVESRKDLPHGAATQSYEKNTTKETTPPQDETTPPQDDTSGSEVIVAPQDETNAPPQDETNAPPQDDTSGSEEVKPPQDAQYGDGGEKMSQDDTSSGSEEEAKQSDGEHGSRGEKMPLDDSSGSDDIVPPQDETSGSEEEVNRMDGEGNQEFGSKVEKMPLDDTSGSDDEVKPQDDSSGSDREDRSEHSDMAEDPETKGQQDSNNLSEYHATVSNPRQLFGSMEEFKEGQSDMTFEGRRDAMVDEMVHDAMKVQDEGMVDEGEKDQTFEEKREARIDEMVHDAMKEKNEENEIVLHDSDYMFDEEVHDQSTSPDSNSPTEYEKIYRILHDDMNGPFEYNDDIVLNDSDYTVDEGVHDRHISPHSNSPTAFSKKNSVRPDGKISNESIPESMKDEINETYPGIHGEFRDRPRHSKLFGDMTNINNSAPHFQSDHSTPNDFGGVVESVGEGIAEENGSRQSHVEIPKLEVDARMMTVVPPSEQTPLTENLPFTPDPSESKSEVTSEGMEQQPTNTETGSSTGWNVSQFSFSGDTEAKDDSSEAKMSPLSMQDSIPKEKENLISEPKSESEGELLPTNPYTPSEGNPSMVTPNPVTPGAFLSNPDPSVSGRIPQPGDPDTPGAFNMQSGNPDTPGGYQPGTPGADTSGPGTPISSHENNVQSLESGPVETNEILKPEDSIGENSRSIIRSDTLGHSVHSHNEPTSETDSEKKHLTSFKMAKEQGVFSIREQEEQVESKSDESNTEDEKEIASEGESEHPKSDDDSSSNSSDDSSRDEEVSEEDSRMTEESTSFQSEQAFEIEDKAAPIPMFPIRMQETSTYAEPYPTRELISMEYLSHDESHSDDASSESDGEHHSHQPGYSFQSSHYEQHQQFVSQGSKGYGRYHQVDSDSSSDSPNSKDVGSIPLPVESPEDDASSTLTFSHSEDESSEEHDLNKTLEEKAHQTVQRLIQNINRGDNVFSTHQNEMNRVPNQFNRVPNQFNEDRFRGQPHHRSNFYFEETSERLPSFQEMSQFAGESTQSNFIKTNFPHQHQAPQQQDSPISIEVVERFRESDDEIEGLEIRKEIPFMNPLNKEKNLVVPVRAVVESIPEEEVFVQAELTRPSVRKPRFGSKKPSDFSQPKASVVTAVKPSPMRPIEVEQSNTKQPIESTSTTGKSSFITEYYEEITTPKFHPTPKPISVLSANHEKKLSINRFDSSSPKRRSSPEIVQKNLPIRNGLIAPTPIRLQRRSDIDERSIDSSSVNGSSILGKRKERLWGESPKKRYVPTKNIPPFDFNAWWAQNCGGAL